MKLSKLAFSLFFLTCFLTQLIVPLHHALEEHLHKEQCNSNDVVHFCNHDTEKHEHYFELNLDYLELYAYQLDKKEEISTSDVLKQNFLTRHQQLPFSLRAPPFYSFM